MTQVEVRKSFARNTLLSAMAFLAMLACVEPAWAILGVWRRAAFRTAVVVGATETAAVASANASREAAATAQAQSAANASAAAAKQAQESANQAAAQAKAATATKTPQQKLQELQSLYDQKLISQSDYEAAKKKILGELMN
jgi:hypothetical protein